MRSSAAQKKQARRADINRKARKEARRAERRTPDPLPVIETPARRAARRDEAQAAATRAAVIEDARVARRLAKLCPEVRRRFGRALGPAGFALTLHNDIIEVRVTNGPTYGIRVNAFGVPSPLVWLGTRITTARDLPADEAQLGPLRYDTYLGDWATFDVRPGTRHLAKRTVTWGGRGDRETITRWAHKLLFPAVDDPCGDSGGVMVVDSRTAPGYPELLDLVHRREPSTLVVVGGDADLARDLSRILDGDAPGSSGVLVKPFDVRDVLGRFGAIAVDDNGAVSVDCRSDEG